MYGKSQKQNPILILNEFSLNFGLKKLKKKKNTHTHTHLVNNGLYIVMVYYINKL